MCYESRTVVLEMTLFDDDSSKCKLDIMQPLEVMFDDGRNHFPLAYYHITDVPLGGRLRVTFERLDALPIDRTWRPENPDKESRSQEMR